VPVTGTAPPPPPPALPTVAIAGPATGTAPFADTITTGVTVDPTAKVVKVALYESGAVVATATAAPYSFSLTALDAGSYAFQAVITDSLGQTADSNTMTLVVAPAVVVPPPPPGAVPIVLYSDALSGPTTGGENNAGMYVSIFGKNFGSTLANVSVLIGGSPAIVRTLGPCNGRPDIQQITVQVGALGTPVQGVILPVTVMIAGQGASNKAVTFTPNPGRILFVSLTGNDATAVPGNIALPYRHVQGAATTSPGAYSIMKAGDVVVMRAGTYSDLGDGNYFMKLINLNGTAPTGVAGTGPVQFIAYPGEVVSIVNTSSAAGGISGVDTTSYTGGKWVTLAGLHINSGGNAGGINAQIAGVNWRVVNNEIQATTATNSALAGGITGNGTNMSYLGNHIHNIAGGAAQENHGVYIDGNGSYEVAYNLIETVTGGNGFQTYNDGTNGSSSTNNVNCHHNMIHDISKHGINIADQSGTGFEVWDNIVYNTSLDGIRFNSTILSGCKVYNNTVYNTNTTKKSGYAAIANDEALPATAIDFQNNIVCPNGGAYIGGEQGFSGPFGTANNNLFFGGTGGTLGTGTGVLNPAFTNAAGGDFTLTAASPAKGAGAYGAAVAALVTTDYGINPVTSKISIGAYQ